MNSINIDLGEIFTQMSIIRREYVKLSKISLNCDFSFGWSSDNASAVQNKIEELKLSLNKLNDNINNIASRLAALYSVTCTTDNSQHIS